jgi:hypothetical protein
MKSYSKLYIISKTVLKEKTEKHKKMRGPAFWFATCLVCMASTTVPAPNAETDPSVTSPTTPGGYAEPAYGVEPPTIEWFKRELRISPKYVEEQQGVFGLSWAHFMTMVFLALFFMLALVALLVRYRRTKELLRLLIEEKTHGNKN